jgi:hypothetical protein
MMVMHGELERQPLVSRFYSDIWRKEISITTNTRRFMSLMTESPHIWTQAMQGKYAIFHFPGFLPK